MVISSLAGKTTFMICIYFHIIFVLFLVWLVWGYFWYPYAPLVYWVIKMFFFGEALRVSKPWPSETKTTTVPRRSTCKHRTEDTISIKPLVYIIFINKWTFWFRYMKFYLIWNNLKKTGIDNFFNLKLISIVRLMLLPLTISNILT